MVRCIGGDEEHIAKVNLVENLQNKQMRNFKKCS